MKKLVILLLLSTLLTVPVYAQEDGGLDASAEQIAGIVGDLVGFLAHFADHKEENLLALDYTYSEISCSPFPKKMQIYGGFLSLIPWGFPSLGLKFRVYDGNEAGAPMIGIGITWYKWLLASTALEMASKDSGMNVSMDISGISPHLMAAWTFEDDFRFFVALKYTRARIILPELSLGSTTSEVAAGEGAFDEFSVTVGVNMFSFVKGEAVAQMGYNFVHRGFMFKFMSVGPKGWRAGIGIYPGATVVVQPFVQWHISFWKE